MKRNKARRVISVMMLVTMMLGVMPRVPIFKESHTIHAAPSSGVGEEAGGWKPEHKPTPAIPHAELEGLDLRDTKGGNHLSTRGSYIGEDDDFFYLYDLSRKAQSNTFYSTMAYALTSQKINKDKDDSISNPHLLAVLLTPKGKEYVNSGGYVADNKLYISDHKGGSDTFVNRSMKSSDGVNSVATLMKYKKSDIIKISNKEGTTSKLRWKSEQKNGQNVTIADIYLQGIIKVTEGGKTRGVYTSWKNTSSAMVSAGMSHSRVDAGRNFNLPIYVKKATNSISYIDVKNNKVIHYEDAPSINEPATRLTNISYTKEQAPALAFPGDSKRYKMVAGAMTLKGYYNESANSSQYMSKVLVTNKNANKKGIEAFLPTMTGSPDLVKHVNSVTSTVKSAANIWRVKSGSEKYIDYFTAMGVNLSKSAVAATVVDPKTNQLKFETNLVFADEQAVIQSSDFSGFQLYVLCEPMEDVPAVGDVVMYNDATGEYIGTDTINYKNLANEVVKNLYGDSNKIPVLNTASIHDYGAEVYDYRLGERVYEPGYTKEREYTVPYTFKDSITTLSNRKLTYDSSNYKHGVTLKEDITTTRADVLSGKNVIDSGTGNTLKNIRLKSKIRVTEYYTPGHDFKAITTDIVHPEEGVPLYRATYKETAPITVLYYAENSGDLIYRNTTYATKKFASKSVVKLNSLTYYPKKISYKVGRDAETDIRETKKPVMTSNDIGVVEGSTINIPQDIVNSKNYIIRVECSLDMPEGTVVDAEYTIPAQHLGYKFKYEQELSAEVEPLEKLKSEDHTYTDDCRDDDPNMSCSGHTCTKSWTDVYGEHEFDWEDNLDKVLNPRNYMFADRGGLTKLNDLKVKGKDHKLTKDLTLDFYSHRVDVDGVAPVFALYMKDLNQAAAESFLKTYSMGGVFKEGLLPNDKYNDKGGSEIGHLSLIPGSATNHEQKVVRTQSHDSCGSKDTVVNETVNTSKSTVNSVRIKVIAEPSIVAKKLPVAGEKHKVLNNSMSATQTFVNTPTTPIDFYPAYKMFLNGGDVWLLGKEKRQLRPVNIAQVTTPLNTTVVDVASTWSRDKVDSGKQVMKGGYQYEVGSDKPAEFKVVTYTVLPKSGFVHEGEKVRRNLLKEHETLVNSLKAPGNFKVVSNLPEAYHDSYLPVFKNTNPHKQGGDNVAKSRIPQATPTINVSTTTTTYEKLQDIDTLFADVDNVKRLKDQLEDNSWYKEKFDGFEVAKQVTTIKATVPKVTATNFIRNGGTNYNDLAKSVLNIPSNMFGMELVLQQPKAKFMGKELDILMLTKPKLFHVRGLVYEDRN